MAGLGVSPVKVWWTFLGGVEAAAALDGKADTTAKSEQQSFLRRLGIA
jgi:hypothetical protein